MSTHDLSSEPLAVSGHAARSSTRFSRSGGGGDDLSGNSRISNARTPSGRTSGANSMDLLSADDAGKRVSGGKARARELAVIHPKFTQESGLHMSSEIETSRGKMVIQHLTNQENSSNMRPSILENCAHFHYEYAEIGPLQLELRDESISSTTSSNQLSTIEQQSINRDRYLKLSKHNSDANVYLIRAQTQPNAKGGSRTWMLRRTLEDLESLDKQLHTCVYDRKYSELPVISQIENIKSLQNQEVNLDQLVASYLTRLGELVCPLVTCGPVLSWLEIDNKGNRYIISDDSDINTPAVAAAYAVKKYVKQAQDEISFQVGDMISVIDMPEPEESVWWRGKRGFDVGFFPCDCVEIIGDKVPSNITSLQDSPSEPTKPVLRKHGKLITFFRSFILSRPARGKLKKRGILKERVFGCDLGEHLLNSGQDVPKVLVHCAEFIEKRGIVDGIYRLSGISSNIQRLRVAFDEDRIPNLYEDKLVLQDIHSVSSLLKMYFRELPNPVCTFHLYDQFVAAAKSSDDVRLTKLREVVFQLPPPNYRTLEYLSRHLYRVAAKYHNTGMTPKNVAIVWAPNLLRCKQLEVGGVAALQGVGVQAVVTEYLIKYCDLIFTDAVPPHMAANNMPLTPSSVEASFAIPSPGVISGLEAVNAGDSAASVSIMSASALGVSTSTPIKSRPKSLALTTPSQLRVTPQPSQKYIDVGGGPQNLPPTYHTIIQLPGGSFKHKKSSTPWKNIFFKDKKKMDRKVSSPSVIRNINISQISTVPSPSARALRPVRSAENLVPTNHKAAAVLISCLSPQSNQSETSNGESGLIIGDRTSKESDELGPLELVASALERHGSPKSHNRSSSHDSYFERKMSVQFQLENSELHTSNLDISEIQVNFEHEDHEMKILSEDETMISTSVGSEMSLRSPLEELPRPNPRGNSPMRYRGGEAIRGGGSPTKTRRLSFKEKFRKFTSPTMGRKNGGTTNGGDVSPVTAMSSNSGDQSSTYLDVNSGGITEEKSLKELLVTALSPESLRRKSVDKPQNGGGSAANGGSNGERTTSLVRGGVVGARVTGKTSPLKKKTEARSSPQAESSAPVKRTKLERDSVPYAGNKSNNQQTTRSTKDVIASVVDMANEQHIDLNDPSMMISFSPSIKFIDASSSYEIVSDNEASDISEHDRKVDASVIENHTTTIENHKKSASSDFTKSANAAAEKSVIVHKVAVENIAAASDDKAANDKTADNNLVAAKVIDTSEEISQVNDDKNVQNSNDNSSQSVTAAMMKEPVETPHDVSPPQKSALNVSTENVPKEITENAQINNKTTTVKATAMQQQPPTDFETIADARKDSLRSDSEYILASPLTGSEDRVSLATSRASEDAVSLATTGSRKPSTTRSDLSYSLAGATVSDNETFSLLTTTTTSSPSGFTCSDDRPITSASEDHPMTSPLSEDNYLLGACGGEGEEDGTGFDVVTTTEHLTDTTTDSITEKCDSMTLREVGGLGALGAETLIGASSQESIQQDLDGANNSEYERGVYTAKLVSSTSSTSADQSHSLPAIESATTTSMVAATRGAVSQHFQQQHADAKVAGKSADGAKMAGTSDASTAPSAVAPPQSLLLSSPAFESVTLRRSPVTSPARNRSVRSDFILNLVQQGINNTSENEQLLNDLEEISEHHEQKSLDSVKTSPPTSSSNSPTKTSPSHRLSGSTIKAMMPQPYNQTKQFKRFSVEEVEDKVTSVLASNEDNKVDKEVSLNDPTVESFGSVQALNLDTSEEDIQLETKDLDQSADSSFYCDIQSERASSKSRDMDGEEKMNPEESGSYYVSVSHLSLNNSLEDKSTTVQMSGSGVQSPGTVSSSVTDKDEVCPAKPPKTPKTSLRSERSISSSSSTYESTPQPFTDESTHQRRSSTRSRESLSMTGGGQPRSVSKTSFENDLDESEMEAEDVEVATSINQDTSGSSVKRVGIILEPIDGRRSAHELSQAEKHKSNKERFQQGGKRFSRTVGAKSSTVSLHCPSTTNTSNGLLGGEGDEGEDGEGRGGDAGYTPILQRRNSIHIIPYVDVNDPETRCRMERYKEERRSILRSKYKAEDYLTSDKKNSDASSTNNDKKTSQDEIITYKKVAVVEEQAVQPPSVPVPAARTSLQRPERLDITSVASPANNDITKSSPRLSLKIYECKAGSSEFVEKQSDNATKISSTTKKAANDDINKTKTRQQQDPPSPVTLRHHHQKNAPNENFRKLVDLKQPEPNGLWRRGGEDRASDRKTWGSMRSSPRRSDAGGEGESVRPSSIQSADISKTMLSTRNSSPMNLSKTSETNPSTSTSTTTKPNYGAIDESVNVRERASIFGPRTSATADQPTAAAAGKLRTVSVSTPPVKDRQIITDSSTQQTATTGKLRAISVGGEVKRPVLTGSLSVSVVGSNTAANVTSPNKIKNMAAMFEQNVK